jgi:Cytochrome c554 and c-prime
MARATILGAVALAVGSLVLLGTRGLSEAPPARGEPAAVPAAVPAACPRPATDQAATCEGCHPEIHAEWRGSGHATAFEDRVFRAEYEPAPSSFCADCHAAGRARHGHRAQDGVDCAACHAAAEGERAGPKALGAEGDQHGGPPKKGWRVCAGCHQFAFPPGALGLHGVYDPADPLQDTVHEWQASDAAREGRDCLDCHMPFVAEGEARHRSHRLVGAGDPDLVREALIASAAARVRPEGLEITVTLTPGEVGHRVPTGDMFRRLRVAAWNEGDTPVEQWLGREFAQMPASDDRGFRLRPVLDDRVPAPGDGEPVHVRLLLPGVRVRQAHWSVELHRMPPAQARARGLDPATLSTPVAEGIAIASAD